MPDDSRDAPPRRPRVLDIGAIPAATNRAGRDVKANDPVVVPPPLTARNKALDPVPLARGVYVEDSRRFVGRHPDRDEKVFENLTIAIVDHDEFGSPEAKSGFPRYGAFVYDTSFLTFRSFFHNDLARCLDFGRYCGVIGGEKDHLRRKEGDPEKFNVPEDRYLSSIAQVSSVRVLLEGPRPIPLDMRTAMLMGDALMKHKAILVEAMKAGYLKRTFGRLSLTPPKTVVLQGVERFSPERLSALRFCLSFLDSIVACPAGEVEATRSVLRLRPGSVVPLPAPADPSGPLYASALDGAVTGWCQTASDQDRWLRSVLSGAQTATVDRTIALEDAFAQALARFDLLPIKAGARRHVVVLIPLAVATEVAGRDQRRTRTYRPSAAGLALDRLREAIAKCPQKDDVVRFNRFDVARIPDWNRGFAWMVDAVAEARASDLPHLWSILDVAKATSMVRRLGHEDVRKVIQGLVELSHSASAAA